MQLSETSWARLAWSAATLALQQWFVALGLFVAWSYSHPRAPQPGHGLVVALPDKRGPFYVDAFEASCLAISLGVCAVAFGAAVYARGRIPRLAHRLEAAQPMYLITAAWVFGNLAVASIVPFWLVEAADAAFTTFVAWRLGRIIESQA